MFNRIFGIAALFAILLGSGIGEARAQALTVGYTDHEVIILNMPRYQEIQRQLQQEYTQGQQELQTKAAEIQGKIETYQKQQALLSAETRQQRENELMQAQTGLQQEAQQKEQAMQQRQADLMQPILQSVETAIQNVAQQQNIDIVLRSQVGAEPLLLYVNEERVINITEDVARALGIDVDEAPTAAGN